MRLMHRRQRGVILIIVMWLLAALSLLTLGLAYRLRLEARIMRYRNDRREMLELARAAVTLARARIERSEGPLTYYGQPWAAPIVISEADLSDMGSDALQRWRVEALVFDELGKLNVNAATRGQLMQIPGMDEEISAAIIDWRDEDNDEMSQGAEARYYQELTPPYISKNAPLESIWELLLVRGIDTELFAGRRPARLIDEGSSDWAYWPEGLRDFLTVHGQGRININTAGPEVLAAAVPGLDSYMIENLLAFRRGVDGVERTGDDRPIESFDELEQIGGMTEFAINQAAMHCVLSSQTFHIHVRVSGVDSTASLELDVGVRRSGRGLETLYWREI